MQSQETVHQQVSHYQGCSNIGKDILEHAKFPHIALLDMECFNVIDFLECDFYSGNCLKYLWRLGRKTNIFERRIKILALANIYKDLNKAKEYAILYMFKNSNPSPWMKELTNSLVLIIADLELQTPSLTKLK